MKVIYFLNRFPLVSETFVIDQICGLIDRGVDVEIVSIVKGDYKNLHSKVVGYELVKKTTYLAEYNKSKFLSRLSSLGMSLLNYSIVKYLNVFKYGDVAKNFILPLAAKKLRGKEADFVIAHFGTAGVTAMKIQKAGIFSGKLIPIFHGADISKKNTLIRLKKDYEDLFRYSLKIIPISELWKNKLTELGAAPEKLVVNRMGIDLDKFQLIVSENNLSEPLNIVSVARMVEKKGLDDALNAMKLLANTGIKFKYSLVGGGPLEEWLKKLAVELNIDKIVTFHGVMNQDEINIILATTDVFLLPSKTAKDGDMEGVPVALMESMAKGIVTVSTFHSGIPELIQNEKSGFLVQESSPQEIANLLSMLVKSSLNVSAIRESGRRVIAEKFNQKLIYDELYTLLDSEKAK
jgi:colanic acid/amylovoran biosynthesis glycosyltransferase